MKKMLLVPILLVAALTFSLIAHAQDYPTKPIRVIVAYPPGGSVDAMARLVAEKLRAKWGQPVIVDNRPGAAGNIGSEAVFRAAPDGYTLLFVAPQPLVINKSLYPKLSYDPDAFVPVSLVSSIPHVLIVHPKVPANDVRQLIGYAKANPDRLNYASSGGAGSTSHLAAELFKSMSDVRIVHVPYKGTAPALSDLVGGQVQMTFMELDSVFQHIRAGTVRALAVGSEKRNPFLPDIPTMSEVLPGFVSATWRGMVAPPGTPPAIASKLSAAVAEALKEPQVAKWLVEMSVDAIGSTPAQMDAFMKRERERWGTVIRATGTTAE